ncbi:putative RNA-directed DNA polymerase from transposon BS [Apostichopus japonicus]|uniref:Putative RNA-directed DNA polymerase from transposon BS n=1 Tax=Stichopus japonicus TaxID=307972 RepID=A0A2G8JSR8_STIJA|nr:putative RNA-directed DNA polymerase from transposon BS [Apostichopus japonicus]
MLRIQNDLLEAVDQCQEAVLVLLDFSVAFDTNDHDIILERLENRYTARKWLESYLRGRSFSVNIKGARSIPRNLNDGVPQGSVLGPSIFAMYVAPLGDIVSAHARKKHSKTEVLNISSKFLKCPTSPKIAVDNSFVDTVLKAKSLGVIVDCNLNMKHHVKNTASVASFALYKIGQLAKYLDHKSTERLVHALITSRLNYCNSLLCGIPSTELSKVQLIQNSVARLVTRSQKHDHITPILRDLH